MSRSVSRAADAAAQAVRFYDAEAATYDASRYTTPGGRRVDAFHKRVLHELLFRELSRSALVLEVGCGTGRLLAHWRATHPQVFGIDASAAMLQAPLHESKRGHVLQGDAYHLPFADGSFDAAYSILVLNLFARLPHALAEVRRVLRRGGRLLFNVPNLESIYLPGGLFVNLRQRTVGRNRAGFRPSHWFRRQEIERLLADAGLMPIRIVGQPAWTRWWPDVGPVATTAGLMLCNSLYVLARRP